MDKMSWTKRHLDNNATGQNVTWTKCHWKKCDRTKYHMPHAAFRRFNQAGGMEAPRNARKLSKTQKPLKAKQDELSVLSAFTVHCLKPGKKIKIQNRFKTQEQFGKS